MLKAREQVAALPTATKTPFGPRLGHEREKPSKSLAKNLAAKGQKAPVCGELREWPDPDSNWGHHDFQSWGNLPDPPCGW